MKKRDPARRNKSLKEGHISFSKTFERLEKNRMCPYLKKFLERYENMPIGPGLWLSTALFIIFVRDGIECFIASGFFGGPDDFHLVHVPIFFFSLLLSLIIILHFFAKTDILKVSKIALVVFPLIIFPVVLDFAVLIFGKTRTTYLYIVDNPGLSFLHFFDPMYRIPELPLSIRFEVGLITFFAFVYIFLKRRRVFASLIGSFLVFILCFFYVSIPALLLKVFEFMAFIINTFHLKNFPFVRATVDEVLVVLLEVLFTGVLCLVWLWRYDPAKYSAVLKNVRPTRTLHYMFLCFVGVLVSVFHSPIKDFFSLLYIVGALLSVGFAFQFSVVINDIYDLDCDRVSNAGRPLVTGALNKREYLRIGFFYLAFSILCAYWVGPTCFTLTLLFIAFYFLYSAPPLRLKRFFPVSVLVIGLQAVLAFLIGAYTFERSGVRAYLPALLLWLIFIVFFFSSNIKDLKDTSGDRETGIPTLPVLLGEEKGRKVIAFLVFLSYCLVPLFLGFVFPGFKAYLITLLFALLSFICIQKKSTKEEIIFLIYFIYVILLIFYITSLKSLAG